MVEAFTQEKQQAITSRLQSAFQQFEQDSQLRNALSSLYVIERKTGKEVFAKNAAIGLAPASTQKVITSATAYELLGKDFRYRTDFGIIGTGAINPSTALYVIPSGDPTLGSWRWEQTKENSIFQRIAKAFVSYNNITITGVLIDTTGWNDESIPDGWIWEDIGNYYGAGASALNWRENQFDVHLRSGTTIGSQVEIVTTEPKLFNYRLKSFATAAGKGTGDNAFIYFPLNDTIGVVRGTIPINESKFTISGALPAPAQQMTYRLLESLAGKINVSIESKLMPKYTNSLPEGKTVLHSEYSPILDSIIFWLNRKSINLYGEALVKTIGYKKKRKGSTSVGVEEVKKFWKDKGVAPTELNIVDGSGLSPLNRVTTKAQVFILQYAQKQPWFSGFYQSLPEYNGMKMKSGTIHNVKGFCGYHTSKEGTEYIFSFLVNNYNGSSATVVQKMYKVLDVLK
ncbi:MAG: D-alanyl-D-alanine carboxypeptidase/D-alanyl-D-alanine-endopeptidase [Flavisolibacter sp.]|nr:D-alanyl-D-alanine carboxypeptidase/D-alanyl-D-alanine-endopeptidase [Flavisolibacter sp.]